MADEQDGAKRSGDLFEWVGALVVSLILGVALAAGWLWLLTAMVDHLPVADDGGLDDIAGIPIRSLKLGLLIGGGIVLEQVHRILVKEVSQFGTTVIITLLLTSATSLASYIDENIRLQVLAAAFLVSAFSALHLLGVVVVKVTPWLVKSTLPGMATALSLSAFMPVCGYAAVGDEFAASAEPATTLDAADVVARLEQASEEGCYERVAKWRDEAISEAQRYGSLTRVDAENVVTGVIISVCKNNTIRIDLQKYFFKSVYRRTADPWRAAKREPLGNGGTLLPDTRADPLKDAMNLAATRCVERVLSEMPLRQAQVMRSTANGDTNREIADRLGIGKSQVNRELQAARAELRQKCRDYL